MDSSSPHASTVHSIFSRVLEPSLNRQKVLLAERQVQELLNSRAQSEHVFPAQNKFWQAVYFKLADHYRMASGYGRQPGSVMVIRSQDSCMPETTIAQYIADQGFPIDELSDDEEEDCTMNVTMIMKRRKDQGSKERSGGTGGGVRDGRRIRNGAKIASRPNNEQTQKSIEEREAEYERLRAEIFQGSSNSSGSSNGGGGGSDGCAQSAELQSGQDSTNSQRQCVPGRNQPGGVRGGGSYQAPAVRPPVRPWKQLYDPKGQSNGRRQAVASGSGQINGGTYGQQQYRPGIRAPSKQA